MSKSTGQTPEKDDAALAYDAMLRLLAKREYSAFELRQKLRTKYPKDAVLKALNLCIEKNYQSDLRYAQMLLRHCEFSLTGPIKLKADLIKKGIGPDIDPGVGEVSWEDLAHKALCKKFRTPGDGPGAELDYAARQKALAYLGRRGFTQDQCLKALQRFCL